MDYWESVEAWQSFREEYAAEFEALDRECEELTLEEREIGHFLPDPGGSGTVRERLFHIARAVDARALAEGGEYRPPGFASEGFVHCSYARQVVPVANARFRGAADLVLLEIDPERLSCRVVDENLEGGSELFPHVYGPVPAHAVVRTHAFPGGAGGRFELPDSVGEPPPGS